MKLLRRAGYLYFQLGFIYSLWSFLVLSFRNCPTLGGACLDERPLWTVVRQLAILVVAAFRGLLWLPEMTIATVRGQLVDWLLLRNLYNFDAQRFLAAFSG